MYKDEYQNTFEELVSDVLPRRLDELKAAIAEPKSAGIFSRPGIGVATILRELAIPNDFSGCYVFMGDKPIYVGVSRGVVGRLRQHLTGKTHYDASLAYSMAQRRRKTHGKRCDVMRIPEFLVEFRAAQQLLRSLSVAFIPIENPVVLYVFEAFAAMCLETHEWNTFRTH